MNSRAAFSVFVLAMIAGSFFPACIVYVVDPMHFFHKSLMQRHGFDRGKVFSMTAGIIDNYVSDPEENFDSVVIGASTSTGYTSPMFNKMLGWGRTANLSIAGSNPGHHQIILQKALKIPGIKHAFIELSHHYGGEQDIFNTPQPIIDKDDPMPIYLYDDIWLNNTKYLFDANMFYEAIGIIFGVNDGYDLPVETPSYWANLPEAKEVVSNKKNIKHLIEEAERVESIPFIDPLFIEDKKYISSSYSNVDNRLAPVLMEYCNKNLDIVINFSPKPTELWRGGESAAREFYARRYVTNIFSKCKNIRVYAEDQYDEIASNPSNFIDNVHYSPDLNETILKKISREESRLRPENISQYEQRVIDNVHNQHAYLNRLIQDRSQQEKTLSP